MDKCMVDLYGVTHVALDVNKYSISYSFLSWTDSPPHDIRSLCILLYEGFQHTLNKKQHTRCSAIASINASYVSWIIIYGASYYTQHFQFHCYRMHCLMSVSLYVYKIWYSLSIVTSNNFDKDGAKRGNSEKTPMHTPINSNLWLLMISF